MFRPRTSVGSSAEIAVWSPSPVLGTTRYDRVSAGMIALLFAMCVLAGASLAIWLVNLRFSPPEADPEITSTVLAEGDDSQTPEPLKVETPADPSKDPSLVDVDDSEPSAEQTINDVLLNANATSKQLSEMLSLDPNDGGTAGSLVGDADPPISSSDREIRPEHLRWYIRFPDRGSLETYAAQLDYFGIEVGVKKKGQPIVLLSNVSRSRAKQTTITSGTQRPNVMTFLWIGGGRKRADLRLFKEKAGIDASTGIILHLYPAKTVQLLRDAERKAAKRPVRDILRTYFSVVRTAEGFAFVPVRIVYRDRIAP